MRVEKSTSGSCPTEAGMCTFLTSSSLVGWDMRRARAAMQDQRWKLVQTWESFPLGSWTTCLWSLVWKRSKLPSLLGHSIFGVSLYFSLTFKILTSVPTITSFQVFFGQIISLQNTGCGNNTIYQKISATIILSWTSVQLDSYFQYKNWQHPKRVTLGEPIPPV